MAGEAGIFDYPAGYDDLLVALASSTIRPQQFGEVWMSGSSTAGASMGAGQPPTGAQPLTYDGSAGYDYPLGYDAEAYVPATASMTPAPVPAHRIRPADGSGSREPSKRDQIAPV